VRIRQALRGAAIACCVIGPLVAASTAVASSTPVTINFDNLTAGTQVTGQYGPAEGIPAGPTFMTPSDAGFEHLDAGCGPPHIDDEGGAHSGANALVLDGCVHGEFYPSAGFFSLGYSTNELSFWVSIPGGTPSFCGGGSVCVEIWTTGFNAKREVVAQEQTLLGTNEKSFKEVPLVSSEDNIAFVSIEVGSKVPGDPESPTGVGLPAANTLLLVDDLTYNEPSSPPESSFLLGAKPPSAAVAEGGEVGVKIPITWTNNPEPSKSPVELEASTPSGVSASFAPNPTGSGSSTMTLHATKSAPVGRQTVTVTGYVDRGEPSEKKSSVEVPLEVLAPFEISPLGKWAVAPCTPQQIPLRVATVTNFAEPLTLTVNTSAQPGVRITGISGGGNVIDPSHATTTVTPQNGEATATLTVEVPSGTSPASARFLTMSASAPGYSELVQSGTIAIEAGHVTQVNEHGVPITTSQLASPGSQVTATGAGFCPGTRVAIGDADETAGTDNVATPESISPDGTSLTFRAPRGAVTGPLMVIPPSGTRFNGPNLTVHSFRNTFGFSWINKDYGMRLNDEITDELFGKNETNINVFGWEVRKPETVLFETMTNNHIPGGLCFGIAYSSLEFHDFPGESARFPHEGPADPWHMTSPSGPSEALLRYVTQRFSLQFTDELIPAEVNTVLGIHGTNDDINTIKEELAAGHPVPLGLVHWNGISIEGHTVLAYDTQPLPGGATAVLVANSNVPYATGEQENAEQHDSSQFTRSEVIIKEGNWEFPEGAEFEHSEGKPWKGSEAGLVVYKHNELPIINGKQPHIPNLFAATVMVVFGSAGDKVEQLSDGHGSLFSNGQLAPQTSWPKGVAPVADFTGHPGPLQLVSFDPKTAGPLTATVGRSAGGGAMSMNLPGLQASLQTGGGAGSTDHVSVNPHTDAIGYNTSASHASLGGTLLSNPAAPAGAASVAGQAASASPLGDRLVQFKLTSSHGGGETVSFPTGHGFVLHHAGAATNVALTLSSFAANGQPVAVTLPAQHVVAGETLKVTPSNWRALGSGAVRVSATVHGRTRVRYVHGRPIGRRYASVRTAKLKALGHHRYRIALTLGVHGAPKGAWISVAASVLRHGHKVEQAAPLQLSGAKLRRGRAQIVLPRALAAGHYALQLRLLEATTVGPVQGSVVVSKTLSTRVK